MEFWSNQVWTFNILIALSNCPLKTTLYSRQQCSPKSLQTLLTINISKCQTWSWKTIFHFSDLNHILKLNIFLKIWNKVFVLRSLLTFKISSLHAAIIYNSMTSIIELYWGYFTNFFIIILTSLYFQIKKLCVCICVHVWYVCMSAGAHEGQCDIRCPWSWNYRWWWAALHRCWEQNSGSLEEQQVFKLLSHLSIPSISSF